MRERRHYGIDGRHMCEQEAADLAVVQAMNRRAVRAPGPRVIVERPVEPTSYEGIDGRHMSPYERRQMAVVRAMSQVSR